MPQIIEIPDIGQVEFPDGMSDADIARAIQNNYGPARPPSPLGFGAARQKAELEAAADEPSAVGSFARNARENIGAGLGSALAGTVSGAGTGAALGAMGLNPFTVGAGTILGGLVGGVAGAFGGQKIQEAVDPITAERQAALARDMEVNPIASFGGQVAPSLITGKPSIKNITTALKPLGQAANAAERAAIIGSRINVGSEAAISGAFDVGQSLATGQPMDPRQIALNAATGALFSDPNRLGRALGQGGLFPAPAQPAQPVAPPNATAAATPATVAPPITSQAPPRGPMAPIAPAPPLVATGATRLAGEIAQQAGIEPLTLTPSGAGATVTPNDVRSAASRLPATTMDSGGTIDVTPPRKPDPTLSDLIDTNIEWDGQAGRLVDDEGRPALLRQDGALVELPFNYGTDRSLTELGVQPTFDRQQDRATATRFFGETENESLQSVFGVIDNNTDDLLDVAELGVSLKKQQGKKSIPVYDTPEFAPQLRSITDEQILVAEDQIKQAIDLAQNNPNLSDETRTAVINKLSGDLENISAITAARDSGKYQRLPLPVGSAEVSTQRPFAPAASPTPAASRVLTNALPAEASAAPVSAKLTSGPEETGIAPVAPENAGTSQQKLDRLRELRYKESQSKLPGKLRGEKLSKEEALELASLTPEARSLEREAVDPTNDKIVGMDINRNPIYESNTGTYYTFESGRPRTGPAFSPETPAPNLTPKTTEAAPQEPAAQKELSARTRVKKLAAEIERAGKRIMDQRVKISELKKSGAPKQTITKAENQLARLQSEQKELAAQRAAAKSEIPRTIQTISKAASRILREVYDNINSFTGLRSLDGNRIKRPSPRVLFILAKQKKKIPLTAKENNILAANVKGGEYDDWIKISDIDAMPGTPEGREAAKEILRSIYAPHDDYSARGPDTVVTGKDADILWSELRSDLEDIAQGKTGDYEDAFDREMARLEKEFLEKEGITPEEPKQPVSQMDIRNQDSRELFADDGGFALAAENTQDGAKITAERNAKEEAERAQDEAQNQLFDEEEDDDYLARVFAPRPDEISSDPDPFSKTDAPARAADIAGVEKAADDFFGGKRPENVKVVNQPNANWEARVNGDTIELNAAKVGPEGVRSALHEEVGHAAFRNEKDRATFQKLYDNLDEATRTKINETVDKLYSDASPSLKAEEKLVKALRTILDRTPEGRTFWQKLMQIARRTWKTLTGQTATDPEMIAAALLRRGIGKVKKGGAGEKRFSATKSAITPEQVAKHRELEARAKAGDKEAEAEAQRMVDEVAEKAGYRIKAYHGAPQKLIGDKFDRSFIGEGSGVFRDGFSFTTSKAKAEAYAAGFSDEEMIVSWWAHEVNKILRSIPEDSGANVWGMPARESQWDTGSMDIDEDSIAGIPASVREIADQIRSVEPEFADQLDALSRRKPAISEGGKLYGLFLKLNNPRTINTSEESMATDAWGVRAKSDSDVILDLGQGEQIYYVYDPANIKSADPFTYDDNGKLIPLDERFRDTSDDIRYSKTNGASPADFYRKALDAAKQEVADRADYRAQAKLVLDEIKKLPKDQQKPAKIHMYAELDEARIIGKGKDAQFKVEMPKVVQELIATGKDATEQSIINALVAKFPEQKGYLKKNFEKLVADMMFAEEMASSGKADAWGDYGDTMKEHLAEIASGVKDGSTLRHIKRSLSLFRHTYFNGIGGKMQALAEGKLTGKESAASSEFAKKIIGVRASQDGINFQGIDGVSESDLRRMTNERAKFDVELNSYFKEQGMSKEAQVAWLERVSDHVVNPARDAELAKEPKLKEAVDYFIKRRRERLKYLREAGVDVGDAGERSLSRSIDTEKVLTNPKEFVDKAKRAYMRKWAREIADLRKQEAVKEAEGKSTASIKDKIRELEKMDAQQAAEKYLYAITSDDNGISSDGNDITAASGGGQPSFLKKREFGPEADELLGKFYHRNIAAMDTAESLSTVRAATKARVLAADGDPVGGWKKFRAELEAEGNQDMIPIWAQLVKDYLNLNGSNNETVRKLVGHLHTYTQFAYLSHATVASLGEPGLISARTGRMSDIPRAYAYIANKIVRAIRRAGPDEIRELNRELGIVADSFDGMMSGQALNEAFGGRGKSGAFVTNFHRINGLAGITNFTFDAATKLGKSFISLQVRLAKANGSMSTLAKRELNELGMTMKDIDVMDAFVNKLDKSSDQNSLILGDEPGADLYRKALVLFHQTGAALNPTRGTRAQKANNPVAGLFYSLQSYLYDFHQKFTLRQVRRLRDAYRGTVEIDGKTEKLSVRERSQIAIDTAKAAAAIYGLQYGIQLLREQLFVDMERKERDKKKSQEEINMTRMLGAASRTGVLGPYDALFNIVTGARYQREPATVVLGPAVGGMSELFQSVVSLYGDRNSANTNTAERKLARTGYNTIVTPGLNAVFSTMPAGPLSAALVQAFRHPLTRETVVQSVAGPIQKPKKGPMKTTTYY